MTIFTRNPFDILAIAFSNLYPDLKYKAQIVPKVEDESGAELYGETFFPDDGNTSIISISAQLTISDAVEIFAHELAHVATPGMEHSDEWEGAFERIHVEYDRICQGYETEKVVSGRMEENQ